MLPFLVYGAGYNINKSLFFKNMGNILILGIVGTVIAFIMIGIGAYYCSELGLIVWYGDVVHISIQESMLVAATLSATDVVCSLALISHKTAPKLHTILFG
jgi:NhaP-type Na+/H+ or K+/H+ antiporter